MFYFKVMFYFKITYLIDCMKCVHYCFTALDCKKFVKFIKDNGAGIVSIDKIENIEVEE